MKFYSEDKPAVTVKKYMCRQARKYRVIGYTAACIKVAVTIPLFMAMIPLKNTPFTVILWGKFVGRTDRKHVKIFEGDIIKILGRDYLSLIVFENGYFGTRVIFETEYDRYGEVSPFKDDAPFDVMEVVGNIHDNPELLKGSF